MHHQTSVSPAISPDRPAPDISPSALRMAMLRAVHGLLDEPLVLHDPHALDILEPALARALREDPFSLNDPMSRTMRAGIVARSRYAEDALHAAVAQGLRQYVVLGAGWDTLALRNPWPGQLEVYEVDRPAMQQVKRARVQALPAPLAAQAPRWVAADLSHQSLSDALASAGFDPCQPACIVWLGVTPYLAPAAVEAVMGDAASMSAGSVLVLDYRVSNHLLAPLERMMAEHSAKAFAAMGEPWLSDYEPEALHAQLQALGWSVQEDLDAAQINTRYFLRRRDGLQTAGGGFRFLKAVRG